MRSLLLALPLLLAAPAAAQFADDALPLFPEAARPAGVSPGGVVVWQFSTGGGEGEEPWPQEALSAEELCCPLGEDERARQPFCIAAEPLCE